MQRHGAGGGLFEWQSKGGGLALKVACVLLPVILFGALGWIDYGVESSRMRRDVVTTANALTEHAHTVLETVQLALARVDERTAGQDWATLSNSRPVHDFLLRLHDELPQIEAVYLIDPDGKLAATSRRFPTEPYGVRDFEYFRATKEHGGDQVQISAPFLGAQSGTLGFIISKPRITDGRFDGVIGATLSQTYFREFYLRAVDAPGRSAAALVRLDGALLTRYPATERLPMMLPPDSWVIASVRAGQDSGMSIVTSPIDGVARLVAFRRLAGLPLIVAYGIDRAVFLDRWMTHAAVLGGCAVLLSALLLVAERVVRRKSEIETQTLRRLLDETERRRQAEAIAQQSQKMEALGRLSGGIAHDFNNLLTAIMGSLDLLVRREEDPRALRLLRTATEAAKRGAKLTAQMLAFARKSDVVVQSVDANAAICALDDLLRRSVGSAVHVRYELAAGLPPVLADTMQLELSLLNLAVNARDAMPQGGDLTVRTEAVTLSGQVGVPALPAGSYVRLQVGDTGAGMTEDVLARAHEPFFTTKPSGSGTGLGLSMVYGFVRDLGGALFIDSAPGQGTIVSLFLRQADTPPAATPAPPEETVPITVRAGRILLVDDDTSVRSATRRVLEELAHEVVEAGSGDEALTLLRHDRRFDALIFDYAMPQMTGGELAAEVVETWPDAPILFITGYVDNDGLRAWSGRGYETVRKPFAALTLAAAVHRAMRRRKQVA